MKYNFRKESQNDFDSPYAAGYHCGLYGANCFNSHYKWFLSKEGMEEWSKGKKNAEEKNFKQRKKAVILLMDLRKKKKTSMYYRSRS